MAEIALSSSIRTNLLSLQRTDKLAQQTQTRLATGLRVNSAIDDAVAYFQSKALTDRATDIGDRKQEINQAISSLQAANNGVDAVDSTLRQLKGILQSAKTASANEATTLANQFNSLSVQLNEILADSSYQGLNLLNNSAASLTVQFSTRSTAQLQIQGKDLQVSNTNISTGALFTTGAAASVLASIIVGTTFSTAATNNTVSLFDAAITLVDDAISNLRATAAELGSNVTFLNTRLDFSADYAQTLEVGSDKLTLADTNEEGANLVALQTRQQLALQALAFAGQNERAVLSLFR